MSRKLGILSISTLLFMWTTALVPVTAARNPSVIGSSKGHMMTAFSASRSAEGTSRGTMSFFFRDQNNATTNGTSIYAEVTCVTFAGSVTIYDFGNNPVTGQGASIYGVVTRTDNPHSSIGDPIEMEVVDVGTAAPGHAPGPDWTSTILTNPPSDWIQQPGVTPNCVFDSPDKFPVFDGNITVTT